MGKKTALISARGGQGVTLSAAYLAAAAAERGQPVTAVDLCGFSGMLAFALGCGEAVLMNLRDAAVGACEPEDALVACASGLRLMPAPMFAAAQTPPYAVEIRRIVETLSRRGDVIADLPAGSLPDCGAVACFDTIVICSRADRRSLQYAAALRRLLGQVRAEGQPSAQRCEFRLLLTDFSPDCVKEAAFADSLDECIDTVGARLLGVLPHDLSAAQRALSGQPPDRFCGLMRSARDAVRRMDGEKVPLDDKKSFGAIRKK